MAQRNYLVIRLETIRLADHIPQTLYQKLYPCRVHSILRLFKTHEASMPRIMHESQQGQYPQGSIRYDSRRERQAVTHRQLDPILATCIMQFGVQLLDTGDQIVQFRSNITQNAIRTNGRLRFQLQLSKYGREISTIGIQCI
ncbi:hypothetical protein A6752_21360 [Pseudomonas aeruginosa]|nr:hypothetical protein A6752_21360 [Pseudomonas aeruginosa]